MAVIISSTMVATWLEGTLLEDVKSWFLTNSGQTVAACVSDTTMSAKGYTAPMVYYALMALGSSFVAVPEVDAEIVIATVDKMFGAS